MPSAGASSDPYAGMVEPIGAGIGALPRVERSPYRGAGTRRDLLPLYLYEGSRFYLRSLSVGLKVGANEARRFELFLRHRIEGHPVDDIPPVLAGMAPREPGIDLGWSVEFAAGLGTAYAELLRDVSKASRGMELRAGYKLARRRGGLWLRPRATLSLRSAPLNDYYYGVRPEEANAARPAYRAGGGLAPEIGLDAAYALTQRWRLIASATLAGLPGGAAGSPLVERGTRRSLSLGAMYDLSPQQQATAEARPVVARLLYGASTDCDVLPIVAMRCTSVHTQDRTDIAGFEIGRPMIAGLNGWPLDLAAFVGLIQHKEKALQPDFWQINAYIKGYFYGFPWDARLRTRLGWGIGLSYAQRIPIAEQRDLAARGRNTSRLLNTFDPTADVSVGDLVGTKRYRDTYLGAGVSHRSGIFGTSQLLGNVAGGSNYIYGYIETSF